MSEEQREKQQKDEEVIIDFSKLGTKLKSWWKQESREVEHHHQEHEKKSDDEISLDWNKVKAAWHTHSRWLIPLLCILLAMSVSIYLRTMPLRLPIADDWAERSVTEFYQNQVQQQVAQQYPNLPEQNRNVLLETEWQKFYQQNKELIDSQTKELSKQYKNNFRDEQGTTYLLGIDPYYYYRQTAYVLRNGYPGSEIREGKIWDTYRLAPVGDLGEWNFHHWFAAQWHRLLNLFGDFPLMLTFFLVGTVFSALTVIPAFFIGRITTGNNVGGFFTAMLLAVSSFFVSRTTGESSDTDVYAVFFPVLITWLFLEALEATTLRRKITWIGLAGFATGVFAFAWTGWWYIATFILITLGMHLAYLLVRNLKTIPTTVTSSPFTQTAIVMGIYTALSTLFVGIFISFDQFVRVLRGPFQFLQLKAVAVTSYWPNIRTTVAELNVPPFAHVIEQFDGKLYFSLAIIGIALMAIKKNKQGKWDLATSFFFAMWFASAAFATTKGVRFILQLTPAFAIGLGTFLGLTWHYASRWTVKELRISPWITKLIFVLVLSYFLVSPIKSGYSQAYNSAPSVNDAWYNSLTKIKLEAPENIIITSWWDFGHWFKAIAERPVTFDGGNQVGYDAYWVGKSLLTENEKTTVGIVRMLNCGQNRAFNELDKILNDTPKSISLLNAIQVEPKDEAISTLRAAGLATEQIASVVQYTHCVAPADYYITSWDMVGKSGVWGHFGSWDFRKAVQYLNTKKLSSGEAIPYLTAAFNLSEEQAREIYQEVQTADADKWIAPWPGILGSPQACDQIAEQELRCAAAVQGGTIVLRITLNETPSAFVENNPGVVPNSLVFPKRDDIHVEKFSGQKLGISVVLIPSGDRYYALITDPLQAAGIFTRLFFLEGHGLHCFKKFSDVGRFGAERIITWIVDYDCQQENKEGFE